MWSKSSSKKSAGDAKAAILSALTSDMIARMEKGEVPWHRPWVGGLPPISVSTRRAYQGFNHLVLGMVGAKYRSPYWLTAKQAMDHGGHVRAGEKGTPVVFWKRIPLTRGEDQEEGESPKRQPRTFPLLRYYTVFNYEQTEGVKLNFNPYPQPAKIHQAGAAHEEAERVRQEAVEILGCKFTEGNSIAGYMPALDQVAMPRRDQFESLNAFFKTSFHELAHATGHKDRLDRLDPHAAGDMGSDSYSREELTAEMASVGMVASLGLDSESLRNNSAAYLRHWAERCKQDPMLLITAATRAQHAIDYCLGLHEQQAKGGQVKALAEAGKIRPRDQVPLLANHHLAKLVEEEAPAKSAAESEEVLNPLSADESRQLASQAAKSQELLPVGSA